MAIKPRDESDTFLREVDDELRRERVNTFFTRYGLAIIGGAIALIIAAAAGIWWYESGKTQAGVLAEKLVTADDQVEASNAKGAAEAIDELAASDRDGYRIAGLFLRANAQEQTNAIPAAIETLKQIANDGDAPEPFRQAALVRQTRLEFDTIPPEQVVERMRPIAQADNPWHGAAGELLGIALMRQNKGQDAARVFEAVARDAGVPESIRARAIQMASSLGIDAIQIDPRIQERAEAAPPAPVAAPTPQAAPAPAANGAAPAPANGAAPAPAKQ